jgi:hypothetical protein
MRFHSRARGCVLVIPFPRCLWSLARDDEGGHNAGDVSGVVRRPDRACLGICRQVKRAQAKGIGLRRIPALGSVLFQIVVCGIGDFGNWSSGPFKAVRRLCTAPTNFPPDEAVQHHSKKSGPRKVRQVGPASGVTTLDLTETDYAPVTTSWSSTRSPSFRCSGDQRHWRARSSPISRSHFLTSTSTGLG